MQKLSCYPVKGYPPCGVTEEQQHDLITEVVRIREVLEAILALRNSARPTAPQGQRQAPPDPGYKCPVCKSPMRAKFAKASGKLFYGCTQYPRCTGIRWEDGNVPKPKTSNTQGRGEEVQDHPTY